jgi:hypothetical protein
MAKSASIITALEREKAWLIAQTDIWRQNARDNGRRSDIRSSCVATLRWSPADYNGWVARAKMRRQSGAECSDFELIRRNGRWWEKDAVRALARLIDLTISDVAACMPFMPERPAGPLRISTRPGGGDAAALARGREAQAASRLKEIEDRQRRIDERMGRDVSEVESVD